MRWQKEVSDVFQSQCERYPKLHIRDLLKALYQSIYGCGHLIDDPLAAAEFIREETEASIPAKGTWVEPLGGQFARVHLDYLKESGLKAETLATLCALSAEMIAGSKNELQKAIEVLLAMAKVGWIPFRYEEVWKEVKQWEKEGFPPKRHTEQFRSAYAPSYRVLHKNFVWALPVFAEIDKALKDKGNLLIAIEGGAAAGKSTLGDLLKRVYDCNLFHMDDFFLRPEQRTPQRYSQPGSNVDYERFYKEVLMPLVKGDTVQYRRFDCSTFQIQPPVDIQPKALNIVEGSYSCHPCLVNHYDLKIFLKVDPELQAKRIRHRNDPACQTRFFEKWLPLERTYFEKLNVEDKCDLVLEVAG